MYMPKIYTTGVTCLGKKKKWTHSGHMHIVWWHRPKQCVEIWRRSHDNSL